MKSIPVSPSLADGPRQVLLMIDPVHPASAALLRGIAHGQRQHGNWSVFVDDSTESEHKLALLRSGRWHGVIIARAAPDPALAGVAGTLPMIDLLDETPLPGALWVHPDNVATGHLGAEHFLERKFRNFGFSGFRNVPWSVARRQGFVESLALAGHACVIHETDYPGAGVDSPLWDAWQVDQLSAWLRAQPPGSAVMACNDNRARQIVRAAAVAGLRVPEDIAVLGVNNDPAWCELSSPEISSIAQDTFEAGSRAVEQLAAWMAGQPPAAPELRIDPVGVVARKSTDVLSLRDHKVAVALDFIREHACRGLTVDEVVNHVHASRSLMESRFRRYVGHSPQAEIRRVQVDRIRHMLGTTDLTLKEIADQAGFVHVEYMCVLFKRLTGETMGQYRRNIRAQEQQRALA